jgi:hypothetical protein
MDVRIPPAADIQAETLSPAWGRLSFCAKRRADDAPLRGGPVRPRTASVDDGRGTRGCGVGRTRVTFVLRHRGRSRTGLRVLRASFVLTPPCLLRVRILPAWGRSSARSLTRVLGLGAACDACRPRIFTAEGRGSRGHDDLPVDPRRPLRPVRADHLNGGPRRIAGSGRDGPSWPFMALGLLRGEILADPRSPPVAWVTARTRGARAPAGRGWPEAECPSPARFRWRRETV